MSTVLALVVLGMKWLAYRLTGSVALYSDALESIVNVAAALTAVVIIRIAARPADADHPYGHTKAEYFSAVLEGVLIVLAAIGIVHEAYAKLLHPAPIHAAAVGLGVSAGASAVNAALGVYLLRSGKRVRSPALQADGAHVLTDVATSGGVIVGTALAYLTSVWILDPLIAILVAVLILVTGSRLVRDSVGGLMDAAVSKEELARIEAALAREMGESASRHDLRTRRAGAATFIDLHLEVPGHMSVRDSHDLCDRLEDALRGEIAGVEVTIHVEPAPAAEGAPPKPGANGASGEEPPPPPGSAG